MKKHHKITASERDQIAWWLACGVTLGDSKAARPKSMQDTQLQKFLQFILWEVFGLTLGFKPAPVSETALFATSCCYPSLPGQ
jgi:hypothetical protein